jgi:hypothetical protein
MFFGSASTVITTAGRNSEWRLAKVDALRRIAMPDDRTAIPQFVIYRAVVAAERTWDRSVDFPPHGVIRPDHVPANPHVHDGRPYIPNLSFLAHSLTLSTV